MKNIKYFLLIIFLSLCFCVQKKSNLDSLQNNFGSIESEKEIKDNNFYHLIKRDSDLFTYEISIGKTIPIKGLTNDPIMIANIYFRINLFDL